MAFKVIILAVVIIGVFGDEPHSSGAYGDEPQGPAQYSFNYGVENAEYGLNYGHGEARDGDAIQGTYSVHLPDSRVQKVTYSVNGKSGYVAEVAYEGEAQYPEDTSAGGYQKK